MMLLIKEDYEQVILFPEVPQAVSLNIRLGFPVAQYWHLQRIKGVMERKFGAKEYVEDNSI